jgi:ferredoxin
MRLYSNHKRPFHLGCLALECLRRQPRPEVVSGAMPTDINIPSDEAVAHAIPEYAELFGRYLAASPAPAEAPVPADPTVRADNLKSHAYFLDAALVGCCEIEPGDWTSPDHPGHRYACVFVVEFGREPKEGEPGDRWIRGCNVARTDLRCAELAVVLAGYLRAMGFGARGHFAADTRLALGALAVRAGVARPTAAGRLEAPYLRRGFRVGVVSTDYALAADVPLAQDGALEPSDAEVAAGVGGTLPASRYQQEESRPMHFGRYPMETIKRVPEPTTLVIREEIGRVPKRGDFFTRALAGDLGEAPKRERTRFAMKHPYALGMSPLIQNMVPLQGTRHKFPPIAADRDKRANADGIKALGYFLGADFVGICRAEPWMYYSHDHLEGKTIDPYHEYAVVMLIDQGYETMEGASGDDWISASMSMRAYMRGAEIAGVMAAHCRRLGFSSRSHTNANSEVIHNPAILMAGLGEVSRIGDTLLNPFIGPRSKSVVFTTDLPMEVDLPIDFGLQDFCSQCRKCARECPCNAISFGPKIMFNGYEIWKDDVEKCTKYRVTQNKGSACGRCMKMCPWNREDTVASRELMLRSIHSPQSRAAIIREDDEAGHGRRNPIKRWWFDLEVIDGVAVTPRAGTNERDLNVGREDKLAGIQKIAIFPPSLQPAGGTTVAQVVPVDRLAGLRLQAEAESPAAARERLGRKPKTEAQNP